MIKLSLGSLLTNAKFVITVLVLVGGGATLLLKDTNRTAAFLSASLKDIGMGVATDQWEPPKQPQMLTSCSVVTSDETVVLSWQQPELDTAVISSYFVGTQENPYQVEVSSEITQQEVTLEERENQFQVIAVDNRGEESLASELCTVQKDTTKPQISITSPDAELLGSDVTITAQISELHLVNAGIQIKNQEDEVVAEGGELVLDSENQEQTELSFNWDASGEASATYTAIVTAADEVGLSTTIEKEITLDTQKPTASLSMVVPTSNNSGLLQNGGFEQGLNGWITQGSFEVSGLNDVAAKPQEGILSAVLGSKDESSAVAIVSQDLSLVADQVESVGFWYYLDPTQGVNDNEGMLVFIDDTLVFEDWLNQEQAAWKYIQVDASSAIDPTITVAYYHDDDKTTGGRLYLDGFVTNQAFALEDIDFELSTSDNLNKVTGFARYTIAGEETTIRTENKISFALPAIPDDAQIMYWAEDSVGNKSEEKVLLIPTVSSVTANEEENQESDGEAVEEPQVELLDTGDYSFVLQISNLPALAQGSYEIIYSHGEALSEGIQGTFKVADGETQITTEERYFGTCSATAGLQCSPDENIRDIVVTITLTDQNGQVVELTKEYTGKWVTTLTPKAVEVVAEEQDAAI